MLPRIIRFARQELASRWVHLLAEAFVFNMVWVCFVKKSSARRIGVDERKASRLVRSRVGRVTHGSMLAREESSAGTGGRYVIGSVEEVKCSEVGLADNIQVAKYLGPRTSPLRPGPLPLQPDDRLFDQVSLVAFEGFEDAVDEGFVVATAGFADERCGGGRDR